MRENPVCPYLHQLIKNLKTHFFILELCVLNLCCKFEVEQNMV